MTVLRRFSCLLVLGAVVSTSTVRAEQGNQVQQTQSLQEQSIARQTQAIGSMAALKQVDSFRQQAESWQRQTSAAIAVNTPAAMKPVEMPSSKPIVAPAPAGQNVPVLADPASARTVARTGFYSTPWPASPDFEMPNVQVQTTACDAMSDGEISSLIKTASEKNRLDASLLRAVMVQESAFRPCAVSTAGAMGLMQIMPETADDLGLDDPFDPASNVDAGARYLKQMLDRYHGNTALALAAYNAGPGRTDKANGVPQIPETIGYVSKILSNIPLF
jgi:soluble lytic murein transglycosylase-like protein